MKSETTINILAVALVLSCEISSSKYEVRNQYVNFPLSFTNLTFFFAASAGLVFDEVEI